MASRKRGFSQLEGGIDRRVPHSKNPASSRDIIVISDDEDERVLSTLDIPIRHSISWHTLDRLRWPRSILERELPVIVDEHLQKISNFRRESDGWIAMSNLFG